MRGWWVLLLGGCGLAAGTAGAALGQPGRSLPGTLAYVRGGMVRIAPAAGGPERTLPESKGVEGVFLDPTGATVLYFVRRPELRPVDDYGSFTRGFVSRRPFVSALPLPIPLERIVHPEVVWTGDGKIAYISGEKADLGQVSTARYGQARWGQDVFTVRADFRSKPAL